MKMTLIMITTDIDKTVFKLVVTAVLNKNVGKELRMCIFLTFLHCIFIRGIIAQHHSDELS